MTNYEKYKENERYMFEEELKEYKKFIYEMRSAAEM